MEVKLLTAAAERNDAEGSLELGLRKLIMMATDLAVAFGFDE